MQWSSMMISRWSPLRWMAGRKSHAQDRRQRLHRPRRQCRPAASSRHETPRGRNVALHDRPRRGARRHDRQALLPRRNRLAAGARACLCTQLAVDRRPDPRHRAAGTLRCLATFEFDAHWALYVENYLERLHVPFVHPGLAQTLELGTYTVELGRWCTPQPAHALAGEPAFEPPAGSPDHGQRIAAYYGGCSRI